MVEHDIVERDILLCRVVLSLGGIQGRKRFQKLMYIAKALGYPVPEDFAWGNYGVYSSELQWELDTMVKEGLIEERNLSREGLEPEYYYSVGPRGNELLEEASRLAARGEMGESPLLEVSDPVSSIGNNEIDALIACLRTLNSRSVQDLELWSSIMYLRLSERDDENLISFLHYLKPQYSPEEIRQGVRAVVDLGPLRFETISRPRSGGRSR